MYQWPLTDSTTIKNHNVVAHMHEAPRYGDSVGETGMEEIMVDVATGHAICLPTAKQLHESTRQHQAIPYQAAPSAPAAPGSISRTISTRQYQQHQWHQKHQSPTSGSTRQMIHLQAAILMLVVDIPTQQLYIYPSLK